MLMKLQTPVTDEKCKVGISYNDKITMLGSCFSDNIGKQLADFGFDVCANPFGTLYNPVSILKSVERLVSGKHFTEDDCVQIGAGDERFCSFSHHTSFARGSKEEFVANANEALENACRHFAESNKVIITLGTSWCFRHNESQEIVSNCLKRPACEFTRERLSSVETAECLKKIMQLCREAEGQEGFCRKEFIFTVSPIRHFKDGAHGNQISKAGLLHPKQRKFTKLQFLRFQTSLYDSLSDAFFVWWPKNGGLRELYGYRSPLLTPYYLILHGLDLVGIRKKKK